MLITHYILGSYIPFVIIVHSLEYPKQLAKDSSFTSYVFSTCEFQGLLCAQGSNCKFLMTLFP